MVKKIQNLTNFVSNSIYTVKKMFMELIDTLSSKPFYK